MTESMFKSSIKLPCPTCPPSKSLRTFWGKPGGSSVTPATQAMDCFLCCPQADVSATSDHAQADWRIAFPSDYQAAEYRVSELMLTQHTSLLLRPRTYLLCFVIVYMCVLDVVLFCLLSFYIFFALFSSSSHDRNFNQLCSIGDACCYWMMTGGSGSPSWELWTASPRGRYGERLQRDSCLKIHM